MKLRSKLAGIAALVAITPAFAQIKINDSLTITGWAVGSYQYTQPTPGKSTDALNVDAGLLQATITPVKKVTANVSLYYRPVSEGGVSPAGSETTLLDAYVSYDAGGGITLTAGKFLSYLGYESFYQISDNMITLANQQFLAPIPGYHEGVKLDYAPDKTDVMGIAVVDSIYNKPGYNATTGDGEIKHTGGFEAYYQNTSVNNLTIWLGAGYETPANPGIDSSGVTANFNANGKDIQGATAVSVFDIWVSYTLDKAGDQIVAEEIYKDGGFANKGSNWLVYYMYNVPNSKVSAWFGVSGENVSGGPSYTKYSVAPNYAYNANLSARLQYSYTNYTSFFLKSSNFFGAEVLFKF